MLQYAISTARYLQEFNHYHIYSIYYIVSVYWTVMKDILENLFRCNKNVLNTQDPFAI